MLKRLRKSSSRVTLVLIGLAGLGALTGCEKEEMRRDVYASKEDCLADWGNSPKECEPAYDRPTGNGARTHYYGPAYIHSGSSSPSSSASRSSRAMGSSSVSRGGFGSSGHSASG
jgi:uncharacterized protein YgiB involved in biofilm formation